MAETEGKDFNKNNGPEQINFILETVDAELIEAFGDLFSIPYDINQKYIKLKNIIEGFRVDFLKDPNFQISDQNLEELTAAAQTVTKYIGDELQKNPKPPEASNKSSIN